jgi:hypothetical protein
MGKYAQNLLNTKTLEAAANHFDNAIKRSYNPYQLDGDEVYEIPMAGAVDVPAIGLEAGYLRLTKFEPCWERH